MVDPYISGKLSVSSFGEYIHWFTLRFKVPSFLEIHAKTPEFGTIIQIILLNLVTSVFLKIVSKFF